jgi:hypothetical protein
VVNPFGFNTPEVVALMSTAKFDQTVRTGISTLSSIDIHVSNEIYALPAGPLAVANTARKRGNGKSTRSPIRAGCGLHPRHRRHCLGERDAQCWGGVCRGKHLPIVKTLESNLAVRFDHLQRLWVNDESEVIATVATGPMHW